MSHPTPAHHDTGRHEDAMIEILDLDAEVLAEHTASIMSWLAELPHESLRSDPRPEPPPESLRSYPRVGGGPRRMADLGCGTGAGTFALLRRFPDAHVSAVDSSIEYLHRVQEKARHAEVAEQVATVHADLDAAWPELGTLDLVWASASLHHLTDPDRTIRHVHDALAPGGLLVVVEPDGFPRFFADDGPAERPGLEGRCHEVSDRLHRARIPHLGADFGPKLAAAGFSLAGRRMITPAAEDSRHPSVGHYALAGLSRIREAVADALPADDLAALDDLLDPGSPQCVLHRGDLALRTTRTVWAARAD